MDHSPCLKSQDIGSRRILPQDDGRIVCCMLCTTGRQRSIRLLASPFPRNAGDHYWGKGGGGVRGKVGDAVAPLA